MEGGDYHNRDKSQASIQSMETAAAESLRGNNDKLAERMHCSPQHEQGCPTKARQNRRLPLGRNVEMRLDRVGIRVEMN
jgi:hypothetical protein